MAQVSRGNPDQVQVKTSQRVKRLGRFTRQQEKQKESTQTRCMGLGKGQWEVDSWLQKLYWVWCKTIMHLQGITSWKISEGWRSRCPRICRVILCLFCVYISMDQIERLLTKINKILALQKGIQPHSDQANQVVVRWLQQQTWIDNMSHHSRILDKTKCFYIKGYC